MSDPHQDTTYTIQDHRSSQAELERLLIHNRMFTAAMGGLLPEQPDPTCFHRVLDIGCGPGGWLLDLAQTYPTTTLLVGIDISDIMLNHARTHASALHLDDRVEFHNMNALQPLKFPNEHFDLVNRRFSTGWLRTWEWPQLLQESYRIAQPGGTIRITEFNVCTESTSPALVQLGELSVQAFYNSSHLFTPQGDSITNELPRLMTEAGLQNVQTCPYALQYQAGTPLAQLFAEDWKHLFRGAEPFLRQWTNVPDNYHDIYQQMLHEMQQPNFTATTRILTAWGTRP